ncbi:MAG: hypothetical protein GDA52_06750 [Rhodobacteraceae bacterium]|nr:hypothetical protein [Paracoccaceae bacterium]
MAAWIKTNVLREPGDVNHRLAEMGLTMQGFLNVVRVARIARANTTGALLTPARNCRHGS